jgi:hypothetical protein
MRSAKRGSFGCDEVDPVLNPDFVDGQDVRVIQARGGVRLLLEAPKPVFVLREVTGYELDGHGTAQGGVVGEIHFAHPACAEQGTNFVPTQSCAGGQMHDCDASQSWHIALGCGVIRTDA